MSRRSPSPRRTAPVSTGHPWRIAHGSGPETTVSRNSLVGCSQPAVSGAGCPVGVVGRLRLLPKRFDREPACLPGEFGRTPVKLLHDGEGFIEQSAGRKILQVG